MELVKVAACILLAFGSICAASAADLAGRAESRSHDCGPSARERINGPATSTSRQKRTLVYPPPSTLLLIFGLGTPLQLDRESVIVGAFTKLIYALPGNASEYTEPGVLYGRTSRWSLYRALARLAEVYGFGEGRACVQRAVCEAAAAPFEPHRGLLHQLLQILFSPLSTEDELEEYRDREYLAAERLGSHVGDNCHALYPECRRSFLDVFSSVFPGAPLPP